MKLSVTELGKYRLTINSILSSFFGYTINFSKKNIEWNIKTNKGRQGRKKQHQVTFSIEGNELSIDVATIPKKRINATQIKISFDDDGDLYGVKVLNSSKIIFDYDIQKHLEKLQSKDFSRKNIEAEMAEHLCGTDTKSNSEEAETRSNFYEGILASAIYTTIVEFGFNQKKIQMALLPESAIHQKPNVPKCVVAENTNMAAHVLELIFRITGMSHKIIETDHGYIVIDKYKKPCIRITDNEIIIGQYIKISIRNSIPEFEIKVGYYNLSLLSDSYFYYPPCFPCDNLPESLSKEKITLLETHDNFFSKYSSSEKMTGIEAINFICSYIHSEAFRYLALHGIIELLSSPIYSNSNNSKEELTTFAEIILDTMLNFSDKWKQAAKYSLEGILYLILNETENFKKLFKSASFLPGNENYTSYPGAADVALTYPFPFSNDKNIPNYLMHISPTLFYLSKSIQHDEIHSVTLQEIKISSPFAKLYIPLPDGTSFISIDNGDGTYTIVRDMTKFRNVNRDNEQVSNEIDGIKLGCIYIDGVTKEIVTPAKSISDNKNPTANNYIDFLQNGFLAPYIGRNISTEELAKLIKKYQFYYSSRTKQDQNNPFVSKNDYSPYPYRELNLIFTTGLTIKLAQVSEQTDFSDGAKYTVAVNIDNLEAASSEESEAYNDHILFFKEYLNRVLTEEEADELITKYINGNLFKNYVIRMIKDLLNQAGIEDDKSTELLGILTSLTLPWFNVFVLDNTTKIGKNYILQKAGTEKMVRIEN